MAFSNDILLISCFLRVGKSDLGFVDLVYTGLGLASIIIRVIVLLMDLSVKIPSLGE